MVPPSQRAEGVRALALGYLYSPMAEEMRREAEAALTAVLDDPAPVVRLALAEAFASAREAPRHCVIALAHDQPEIAALVLGRSPLLRDEDLIDCVARGDLASQCAIARRPVLSAAVSAALAECGPVEALIELAENAAADVPDFSLRRMLARFGAHGALREAMLSRPSLSACVRNDLVNATASALTAFVATCGWLPEERAERIAREACDRETIGIALVAALDEPLDGPLDMVRHLRAAGRLTPAILLRALLSADRSFFEAALAELSGLPLTRAAGFVRFHQGAGFAALYVRAGMPSALRPAFQAALAAQDETAETQPLEEPRLSRRLIGLVLRDCARIEGDGLARVTALLRSLDAEAARQEAQAVTLRLSVEEPALLAGPTPHGEELTPMLAFGAAS